MEPTPVYKNEIIEISRRTEGRQFLMRPDPAMAHLSLYLIAHYAELHGMELICFCVMSDHYHVIAQDPLGRRARFTRDLNRSLSRYGNLLRLRSDLAFWDRRRPFYGRIRDPETLIERIAYVCSNPAHHGAVDISSEWPGALAGPEQWGRHFGVERPKIIEGLACSFPELAVLTVAAPAAVADSPSELESWTARCKDAIIRRDDEARAHHRDMTVRGFGPSGPVGAVAAASAPITTRATAIVESRTPPPVAFGSDDLRETVRGQIYDFQRAYHAARHTWLNGHLDTTFPAGTQAAASRFTRVTPVAADVWSYPFPYS